MPLQLITWIVFFVDKVPEDNDVVAGPWGAIVIVGMIVATVVLLFSFRKQLRRVNNAGLPSKQDPQD